MKQGEIWLLEAPNSKSRPVLIVSRNSSIPILNAVVIAPVTSTVRSIPTCIALGQSEGLHRDCVASFDNLTNIPKSLLTQRLGELGVEKAHLICHALNALADCDFHL